MNGPTNHVIVCGQTRRLLMKQVKNLFFILNIVGCRGVLQLGGPDLWYNQGDPAKVGACKSFLFTASSLVVKIRNTRVKTCFDSLAIRHCS